MELAEITDILIRFALNIVAMSILIFGLYYRRHGDKVLATTAAMFNIFAFAVLATLSNVEFGLAAGFGLFAILALFNLRSEPIGRIEIAYFFGAVGTAVIFSVAVTSLPVAVLLVVLALAAVYLVDHPNIVPGSVALRVTLDRIDSHIVSDPERMKTELSARLGVEVSNFEVTSVNFVNEMAVVKLTYSKCLPR